MVDAAETFRRDRRNLPEQEGDFCVSAISGCGAWVYGIGFWGVETQKAPRWGFEGSQGSLVAGARNQRSLHLVERHIPKNGSVNARRRGGCYRRIRAMDAVVSEPGGFEPGSLDEIAKFSGNITAQTCAGPYRE